MFLSKFVNIQQIFSNTNFIYKIKKIEILFVSIMSSILRLTNTFSKNVFTNV